MDVWTKDYLWKGYTIFELKNPSVEKEDDRQHEPMSVDQHSVHVQGGISEPS